MSLPADIATVPLREISWRMAELKHEFAVSTLVAEALAALSGSTRSSPYRRWISVLGCNMPPT